MKANPPLQKNVNRVFRAVLVAVGNDMTRYQAVECAMHLLRQAGGDVDKACLLASTPYKLDGRFTY